jgi:DNA invertase Pin-like site-specific DNA recombinase
MTNFRNTPHLARKGFGSHNARLIAYLRPCSNKSLDQQRQEIDEYCRENGYYVVKEYVDCHVLGPALQEALQHLEAVDGIIASDLNRFVEHSANRGRDLRPLLHRFLTHRTKHLLVVEEGINTSTAIGQMAAVETISQLKDADEDFHATWFESVYRP